MGAWGHEAVAFVAFSVTLDDGASASENVQRT